MKKIDLHLHTVPSISDSNFFFSLNSLKEYVNKLEIDCIAITNHNLFDKGQFEQITRELDIKVFPGIEIDLEKGHILLISENELLDDFAIKCKKVTDLIRSSNDSITYEQFIEIFPNLTNYLLIPHYDKRPIIKEETLEKLGENIFVGEVASVRKFKACLKESDKLTPVIFSDSRFIENMESYSPRQTYVNVEELTIGSLKGSLSDKSKVCLSKEDGNDLFQATDDGIILSTGLSVIIGERSSGKTYTLERICSNFENIKYLKQFSLLQNDEEKFKELVTKRHSLVSENYLMEFKNVLYEIRDIDLKDDDSKIERYIESLKKYASENDKLDSFSKCTLYNSSFFEIDDLENLKKVISATQTLLEHTQYKDIINKHITDESLKSLLIDLITKHNEVYENNLKKDWVNGLTNRIREELQFRSTTTSVEDVDFTQLQMNKIKIKKFNDLVNIIKNEKIIDSKEIRGFKVVARTKRYSGAAQLKAKSKSQMSFSSAFGNYENPYKYFISLKDVGLEETEFYKYFVDIEYKTLNKYGFVVSGGERSEFNLLHEISDALKHDALLIDEPESSFDNIFLKNEVNELIKQIAEKIPVIVVTHNNTIGASIKPDFLLYTEKKVIDGEITYKLYYGHPTSKILKSSSGETIQNVDILFNCLEAGEEAYYERKNRSYEILKD